MTVTTSCQARRSSRPECLLRLIWLALLPMADSSRPSWLIAVMSSDNWRLAGGAAAQSSMLRTSLASLIPAAAASCWM
jgi:hypothetical protein